MVVVEAQQYNYCAAGLLFTTYQESEVGVVKIYNGTSWVGFDNNVVGHTDVSTYRAVLFDAQDDNEIILGYYYKVSGSSNYNKGVLKYTTTSFSKEVFLNEVSMSSSFSYRGDAQNQEMYCFLYTDDNMTVGPSPSYNVTVDIEPYNSSVFSLDGMNNLYWTNSTSTNSVKGYKLGPIALSAEQNESNLQTSIYPNPATNQIQITSDELQTATFYSIDGALIADGYEVSKSQPLNIDFLSKGLYIVKLTNAEGVVSQQRVVVE